MIINPETLFNILITIIVLNFLKDSILDYLNSTFFNKEIPVILSDIYDEKKYLKSQEYKKIQYRFSRIFNIYSFLILMLFFYLDGFLIVDNYSRSLFESELVISLSFFAIIYFGNDILRIPFSLYNTFIIEEKFGFNKTSIKTFINDKLKSWLLTILFGGGIISFIIFQFESIGQKFWIVAWIFISVLTVLINGLYTQVIVPLFNKQTKLEDGELKSEIEKYSKKVGFNLSNIFVIDGSKRSTKANAFFTGLGKKKKIVLFDTLIEKLTEEEVEAVLAHEVGHYKKKHILQSTITSIITTGIYLFLFAQFLNNPMLAEALGTSIPSFHISILAFGLLFSPISTIIGLVGNMVSRKNEFEADAFAKEFSNGEALKSGLKKLAVDSLSNLTPHPFYVFFNYSHPPLLKRLKALE